MHRFEIVLLSLQSLPQHVSFLSDFFYSVCNTDCILILVKIPLFNQVCQLLFFALYFFHVFFLAGLLSALGFTLSFVPPLSPLSTLFSTSSSLSSSSIISCWNRRQESQTKMQSETEPFIFPKAKAASGSLSAEERLGWRQFGWGGIGYWGGDS